MIIKRAEGLGSKRTSGDHLNDYVIDNGQNTEKSPGDLWRLAVTQTPVKDYQLTLMWKTIKESIIIILIRIDNIQKEWRCSKLAQKYCDESSGCPRGVMVKAMDCGIVVRVFVLQSSYYVHKYSWERYEPPYPPSYGLNSTTTVLLGE